MLSRSILRTVHTDQLRFTLLYNTRLYSDSVRELTKRKIVDSYRTKNSLKRNTETKAALNIWSR